MKQQSNQETEENLKQKIDLRKKQKYLRVFKRTFDQADPRLLIVLCAISVSLVSAAVMLIFEAFSASTKQTSKFVTEVESTEVAISEEVDSEMQQLSAGISDTVKSLWSTASLRLEIAENEVPIVAEASSQSFEEFAKARSEEVKEEDSTEARKSTSTTAKTEEKSESKQSESKKWDGRKLTKRAGIITGPTGKETWYNLNMSRCVQIMHDKGFEGEYWVRSDGTKMFGDYIMVAANLKKFPKGTIVETSLGTAMVCDSCGRATSEGSTLLDIAVNW